MKKTEGKLCGYSVRHLRRIVNKRVNQDKQDIQSRQKESSIEIALGPEAESLDKNTISETNRPPLKQFKREKCVTDPYSSSESEENNDLFSNAKEHCKDTCQNNDHEEASSSNTLPYFSNNDEDEFLLPSDESSEYSLSDVENLIYDSSESDSEDYPKMTHNDEPKKHLHMNCNSGQLRIK